MYRPKGYCVECRVIHTQKQDSPLLPRKAPSTRKNTQKRYLKQNIQVLALVVHFQQVGLDTVFKLEMLTPQNLCFRISSIEIIAFLRISLKSKLSAQFIYLCNLQSTFIVYYSRLTPCYIKASRPSINNQKLFRLFRLCFRFIFGSLSRYR